jgi:hypothetical protein
MLARRQRQNPQPWRRGRKLTISCVGRSFLIGIDPAAARPHSRATSYPGSESLRKPTQLGEHVVVSRLGPETHDRKSHRLRQLWYRPRHAIGRIAKAIPACQRGRASYALPWR